MESESNHCSAGQLEAGHLQPGHYHRGVSQLALWRHDFTRVQTEQLLFGANRGGWKVTQEFEALARTLSLTRSDLSANFSWCRWFLNELWRPGKGPTQRQAAKLTHAVLQGVDPGASSNAQISFRELYRATTSGSLPESAWQAILEWYRSQSLAGIFAPVSELETGDTMDARTSATYRADVPLSWNHRSSRCVSSCASESADTTAAPLREVLIDLHPLSSQPRRRNMLAETA